MMSAIKKAFGFSPDAEEDDEYTPSLSVYNSNTGNEHTGARKTAASVEKADTKEGETQHKADDTRLPADLFDEIIALFNEAQPDFVKKCLDLEAQRSYIIASLSESLRSRLDANFSAEKLVEEKEALEKRIAELEADSDINTLRQENRKLQLSVSRQKRAMLDRINDLEAQVARSNEEKEKLFSNNIGSKALAKANARIKQLEEEKAALIAGNGEEKASEAAASAETAELEAKCKQLSEELERQSTLREQLEVKTSMSDSIINDLRNQLAASRKELEANQSEQEETMEQIRLQLDEFEGLKARKDNKIKELQESNASYKRTIEKNLYNHVETEKKLRDEIAGLKQQLNEAEEARKQAEDEAQKATKRAEEAKKTSGAYRASDDFDDSSDLTAAEPGEAPERHGKRRGRPRKIKIDSELANTDWFSAAKDDPDFGYHEPPRRPANDNAAQLSLF